MGVRKGGGPPPRTGSTHPRVPSAALQALEQTVRCDSVALVPPKTHHEDPAGPRLAREGTIRPCPPIIIPGALGSTAARALGLALGLGAAGAVPAEADAPTGRGPRALGREPGALTSSARRSGAAHGRRRGPRTRLGCGSGSAAPLQLGAWRGPLPALAGEVREERAGGQTGEMGMGLGGGRGSRENIPKLAGEEGGILAVLDRPAVVSAGRCPRQRVRG